MLTCMLTENRCYKTGTPIAPKGVMVHSTGANNPNLKRYVQPAKNDPNRDELLNLIGTNKNRNDWNRSDLDVCVHAFIGKLADGSVEAIQTLPFGIRGWHCGVGWTSKSANDTHISFEICEDGLTDANYFNQVYNMAVKLTANICAEFGFNPLKEGVVICHSEGASDGIASSHADVMHWFPKHGKSMDDFRNDVATELYKPTDPDEEAKPVENQQNKIYKYLSDVPEYFRPAIDKLVGMGVLQGTGNGEINVSYDFCRVMTVLDRMGKLD